MFNPISGASTANHSPLSVNNDAKTTVGQPEIRSPKYQANVNNGEDKKEAGIGNLFGKLLENLPPQIMKAVDFFGDLMSKAVSMGANLFGSVAGALTKAIPFNPFK